MFGLRLAGALWIIACLTCSGLLFFVFVGENLADLGILLQQPALPALVRWRDCESADRRRADCSPGAGGCALVHSRWCRVALCLRIPSAHKRRRSWSTFVEQHDHRIRRRGRAPRIPVSKHRAALLKEGDVISL